MGILIYKLNLSLYIKKDQKSNHSLFRLKKMNSEPSEIDKKMYWIDKEIAQTQKEKPDKVVVGAHRGGNIMGYDEKGKAKLNECDNKVNKLNAEKEKLMDQKYALPPPQAKEDALKDKEMELLRRENELLKKEAVYSRR